MTREETAEILFALAGNSIWEDEFEALNMALEALQERPKGRWHTLHETKLTKTVECTHCNAPFRYKKKDNLIVDDFYYCPNCGREMRGEQR